MGTTTHKMFHTLGFILALLVILSTSPAIADSDDLVPDNGTSIVNRGTNLDPNPEQVPDDGTSIVNRGTNLDPKHMDRRTNLLDDLVPDDGTSIVNRGTNLDPKHMDRRTNLLDDLVPDDGTSIVNRGTNLDPKRGLSVAPYGQSTRIASIVGGRFGFGKMGNGFRVDTDVDRGAGDDTTIMVTSGAFHYGFGRQGAALRPYLAAGPTFIFVDPNHLQGGVGSSAFEVGFRATGGLGWAPRSGNQFFVEMGLGLGQVHDGTLLAGFRF